MSGALLAVASVTDASADPTIYPLLLSGGGTHFLVNSECPGELCEAPTARFSWEGVVKVTVDAPASGVFTGDHVLDLAFDARDGPVGSFSGRSFLSTPSVTVADGQVASLDVQWAGSPPAIIVFSGLGVSLQIPVTHRVGSFTGFASLQPIPEPTPAALMAVGLMGIVAWRTCRRSTGPGRR